jgi:hypothetical protein
MPYRAFVLVLLTVASAFAAQADAQPAPAPAPKPDLFPETTQEFKIGAFLSTVATRNADESRDPSVAGAHDAIAWQLSFDGKHSIQLSADDRIEQILVARYGRIRQEGESFLENADLVDYDGTFKHFLREHHFLYGAVGADTVFTGPEPDEDAFDPVLAKVSVGYGQEYEDLLPQSDKLQARVGVRAQRRFGRHLSDREEEWEIGPEFVARYERKQTESLSYFLQYEAFSEFADLAHISNLMTAGLDLLLAPYLTVRLAARGYYEAEPEDAPVGSPGYDEFSYRQETLAGLTWAF